MQTISIYSAFPNRTMDLVLSRSVMRMSVYAGHIAGTVAGACNHQRLLPLLALCERLDALHGNDRLYPAHLRLKAYRQGNSQEGELAPISTCTTQTESSNTLQLSQTPETQDF